MRDESEDDPYLIKDAKMSITFSPAGNHQYCKDHNLLKINVHPADETDVEYGLADKIGEEVREEETPFELNAANANATDIQRILLGIIEPSPFGQVHPAAALKRLRESDPTLMVRPGWKDGRVIECGLSANRVMQYISILNEILLECERREVDIVWG